MSCEDCLSYACRISGRHSKAASYQADKAPSKTRLIWFHLLPQKKERTEMKNSCKKALCTFVLVLTLGASAFAGEIQNPVAPPPPPVTTNGDIHTGVSGEIQTTEAVSAPEATDIMTEAALNLLQSLLTLF